MYVKFHSDQFDGFLVRCQAVFRNYDYKKMPMELLAAVFPLLNNFSEKVLDSINLIKLSGNILGVLRLRNKIK